MKDYFLIISNTDLNHNSDLKKYIESNGKSVFLPIKDVDLNDIQGIKIFEELKDANEVLIIQTPALQEDEKAMDQVFLAHSLKPEKIKVWEPEEFKISHELKSYVKKSTKSSNLNALLGIEKPYSIQNKEGLLQNQETEDVNIENAIKEEYNKETKINDSIIQLKEEDIDHSIQTLTNQFTQPNQNFPFGNDLNNKSNVSIEEKILNVEFKLDEKFNVIVNINWQGLNNNIYSIRLFRKKVKKDNFRGYKEIIVAGTGSALISTFVIPNEDLWLDHDKNNEYNILIELKRKSPANVFELVDSKEEILIIYHYFNFFSKSITRIVE